MRFEFDSVTCQLHTYFQFYMNTIFVRWKVNFSHCRQIGRIFSELNMSGLVFRVHLGYKTGGKLAKNHSKTRKMCILGLLLLILSWNYIPKRLKVKVVINFTPTYQLNDHPNDPSLPHTSKSPALTASQCDWRVKHCQFLTFDPLGWTWNAPWGHLNPFWHTADPNLNSSLWPEPHNFNFFSSQWAWHFIGMTLYMPCKA